MRQTAESTQVPSTHTLIVTADVSDPASVQNLFAQTKAHFGHLDLLFNNAGTGAPAMPLEELTFAQWQAVMATQMPFVGRG